MIVSRLVRMRFVRGSFRFLAPAAVSAFCSLTGVRAEDRPAGLAVAVSAGGLTDRGVVENVQLYVPAGEPASPFVPAGAFTATWNGFIASELRADYAFQAELAGTLKLSINDAVALEGTGKGDAPLSGQSVRLNKGANKFTVEFKSPESGDAWVRLYWLNKETPLNPVPLASLSHDESPELRQSLQVHLGRDLFAEYRCAKCHVTGAGMPELAMDAPSFNGIGTRRNPAWMAQWILNPRASRPSAHMPALFRETEAKGNAEAIAVYLGSLQDGSKPEGTAGDVAAGKALYEKLHCIACHNPPDAPETDPTKQSQKQVAAKFPAGALIAFLQKPHEYFAWIRMPDFRLKPDEAANLAAFLLSNSDKPNADSSTSDAALIASGGKLVQSAGCLNCHALNGAKSELNAKPLAELAVDRWSGGCLADSPAEGSKAPRFGLSVEQRAALRAFAASDRTSLTRHVPADFAARHSQHLNCRECHGKFDGFPAFDLLGGKLKPEWTVPFIAGNSTSANPRPWIEARMPGFPAYASGLGTGLATSHGLPPKTPAETAADPDLAKAGQKLVSANGGFQCVTCHGVNEFAATQVFEAPGINLALSYARIQPDFFRRWLRSPLSIDPTTKMPGYFEDEGRSQLSEFFGGDGPKTIRAIWEYIRMADKMPKPE
jgi:mono/diheme cytochrome c family protein